MKKINTLLITFCLMMICIPVFADAIQFTVNRPNLRINGDTLPASEIISHTVECGIVSGGPYTFSTYTFPQSTTSDNTSFITPDDFTAGTFFCRAGTTTTDPDGGAALQPVQFTTPDTTFTIIACTAATCGAIAPPALSAIVL